MLYSYLGNFIRKEITKRLKEGFLNCLITSYCSTLKAIFKPYKCRIWSILHMKTSQHNVRKRFKLSASTSKLKVIRELGKV